MNESPYHVGELKAQQLAMVPDMAARLAGMLQPQFSLGGAQFLGVSQMVFLTYLDSEGRPKLSWLFGVQGFAQVVAIDTLNLNMDRIYWGLEPEVLKALDTHPEIGLIAMDFTSRRRFRVNGQGKIKGNLLQIEARQAYGNCPKFIQRRFLPLEEVQLNRKKHTSTGEALSTDLQDRILKADTFFVGSRNTEGQVDASHRGGNPGFIKVLDPFTLQIPDYMGNNMFNTLGNFESDSRSALLFPVFQSGSALVLLGTAVVDWEHQRTQEVIQRYWAFHIDSWEFIKRSANLKMETLEYSPFNPT